VDVACVPRQENPPLAVPGGLPVVQPEMREPDRVAQANTAVRGAVDDRLQLSE